MLAAWMTWRLAHSDRADSVAVRLDFWATRPGDRSSHAAAELQVAIGGVDDGVDVLGREVSLQNLDA